MLHRDFFRFLENKDRLIDKLDLSDEQKERLKTYFKKYPTSEAKIDWNRKDLSWEDFEPLLAREGKSKSQAKKKGLEGLQEGEDYEVVWQDTINGVSVTVYYPLSFLGSETLANPKVEPTGVTGKWCIAGGSYGPDNDDLYFRDYVKRGYDFFFVFTDTDKYAIARLLYKNLGSDSSMTLVCFTSEDDELYPDDEPDLRVKKDGELLVIPEFWDMLKVRITSYPRKLTWESLIITKADGTQWSKNGKVLYSAGKLEDWDEYIIPKECQKILPCAFDQTDQFLKIIIPADSETSFKVDGEEETGVFTGFRGTVELANGCTEVPDECFYAASDLKDVILPPTIEVIGQCAFAWIENDDFWLEVLWGKKKLNFKGLNLKSVELRAFMQTPIRSFPFQDYPGCIYKDQSFYATELKSITLPEGLTELPRQMFQHCSADDQQITLPSTLKRIGVNALGMLDQNNATVRFRGTKLQWANIETESWHGRSMHQFQVVWEPITDRRQLVTFYCEKSPERFAMDQEGNLYVLTADASGPYWQLDTRQTYAEYRKEKWPLEAGPQ